LWTIALAVNAPIFLDFDGQPGIVSFFFFCFSKTKYDGLQNTANPTPGYNFPFNTPIAYAQFPYSLGVGVTFTALSNLANVFLTNSQYTIIFGATALSGMNVISLNVPGGTFLNGFVSGVSGQIGVYTMSAAATISG
jgi:hypothetical protein